ncbi:MAG: hypothetical protein AseanaTS_24890 [Candidatus Pelagadaptatus aseana]|uniref:DUF6482 family protein n=1 Tax=Candidatus Pelagadaptatus aseana TaxID=3120508 RepID=UPI0039B237E5
MQIAVETLRHWPKIDKVIIHSLDLCLYQASVAVEDIEMLVTDSRGKPLRKFNILEMQAVFRGLPIGEMVLRQQSAYDEMVGQPVRAESNTLEVPLGDPYPDLTR